MSGYQLLNLENAKTIKGEKKGYKTAVLYLLPSDLSGKNLCPYSKIAMCEEPCLNTAGRGGIYKKGETTNAIQKARKRRSDMFNNSKELFFALLIKEINTFLRHCNRQDLIPCVRLNGTSDIQWEYIEYAGRTIFEHFPDIQFYDYTKIPTRKIKDISNYHLTWSYSEANKAYSVMFNKMIDKMNVAVVFRNDLPILYKGKEVVNGDENDLRFLDKSNVVVGLKAKGKAIKDYSGFVIDA
tara:strand:+ start:118 stop:837 length:720 start_codon:yes stop_codon:yes gene_type:complete